MPKKKYFVTLNEEERADLEKLVKTGRNPAYQLTHARILLLANTNRPDGGWKDADISEALNLHVSTVESLRKRLVEEGLEASIKRKVQENRKAPVLDGNSEAHLIALVCGQPPHGKGRWTLRLLANQMVELGYIEAISYETVRQTLKKINCNLIKLSHG
jgi:transposase